MSVICRLAGATAWAGRAAWVEAPGGGVGGVDAVDIVWNARLEVDGIAPGRAARRLTGISLGESPDFSANRDQARRVAIESQAPNVSGPRQTGRRGRPHGTSGGTGCRRWRPRLGRYGPGGSPSPPRPAPAPWRSRAVPQI